MVSACAAVLAEKRMNMSRIIWSASQAVAPETLK